MSTPSWRRAAGKFRAVRAGGAARHRANSTCVRRRSTSWTRSGTRSSAATGDGRLAGVRLQLADPADHPDVGTLPFGVDLDDWNLPHIHPVLGLHRHVVKLVELGVDGNRTSYVVKELPDHLALASTACCAVSPRIASRRPLSSPSSPIAPAIATVSSSPVTSTCALPYRTLLSGRGLSIPYLGDRLLDSLVGLLVRRRRILWGDCSLSNALFRRDAGALSAYVIDVETSERHDHLTDGQRRLDLDIAYENVAGGLLDLQAAGRLVADVDPFTVAENIETRYEALWHGVTGTEEFAPDETWRVEQRVRRLHDLGFDVARWK